LNVEGSTLKIESSLRCWVEVDLDAIRRNLRAIRSAIGGGPEILAVIKANAYGHGAPGVARAISRDVAYFGVACIDEAARVDGLGPRVFLLSPCLPAERPRAVGSGYVVTVSSAEEARAFAAIGPVAINFKIDTGMGRVGCPADAAGGELAEVNRIRGITIHSISSHLPSSDDDPEFTARQLARVEEIRAALAPLAPGAKWHVLNSAGIFGFPRHAHEIVRAGLALYGSACPPGFQHLLRPAMAWRARITLVRDMPAGATISYGRTFRAPRPMRVACISAGYADGYPRQVSGRGAAVLCAGVRCSVLGRVTMDQLVVDISEVPSAVPGDVVTLLGRDGGEEISASELAGLAQTISWHIFTGVSSRVRRIYNEPAEG